MGYGEPVPNPRWEKHHGAIIITGREVEPVKVQARPIPGCEVELGRAGAGQCVDLGNHVALYTKHDQRFEAQPMALEVLDTRTPAEAGPLGHPFWHYGEAIKPCVERGEPCSDWLTENAFENAIAVNQSDFGKGYASMRLGQLRMTVADKADSDGIVSQRGARRRGQNITERSGNPLVEAGHIRRSVGR